MMGMQVPAIPFALVGVGAAIAIVGALNFLKIKEELDKVGGAGVDASVGIGLYLCILGGIVIAVCAFLDQQQRAKV